MGRVVGLLAAVAALLLTACQSTTGSGPASADTRAVTATPSPSSDTSSQSPAVAAPSATPPPATQAPAVAIPVMARPAAPRMLTFALLPFGGPHVSGTVQVVGGSLTVSASGLPMGVMTSHALHFHLGSCAHLGGSTHLAVLAFLVAGASGSGSVTVPVPAGAGPGHILILYSTPSPNVPVACADIPAL